LLQLDMHWIHRSRKSIVWLGLPLLLIVLWDITPADLAISNWYGTAQGFPLRDNYWLSTVLHTWARRTGVFLAVLCIVAIWWPVGPWRHTTRRERVWLACTVWACAAGISLLKFTSLTSCPWDLQQFGGTARYVWHFTFGGIRGGTGGCFPSGHASTFFSFLPVFWLLRRHHTKRAWWIFAAICVAGLAMSWVQVMRGAHFPSHVLWTLWLSWSLGTLASPWLQPGGRPRQQTA
jgi:membrane-associated PAP2 superfamily phosphatase